MTGHLVLLVAPRPDRAPASIARLEDMGVEPSLLATSVNCIVAQRLARRLCPSCREAHRPPAMRTWPSLRSPERPPIVEIYRARGCAQCSGTGYSGRVALYEVLAGDGTAAAAHAWTASAEEIHASGGRRRAWTTLRRDGMRLVRAGISSLEEVRRVSGDWLD